MTRTSGAGPQVSQQHNCYTLTHPNNEKDQQKTLKNINKNLDCCSHMRRRIVFSTINPLKHRFDDLLRPRAASDPSTADARLQVIGLTCHLASLLPAPKPRSDRLHVDHLDRQVYGCCLTDVGAHEHVGAHKVAPA